MSDATHTPPAEGGTVADKQMTRGQFLTAATVGVGGVMGLLLAAPVAGLALAPVFGGEDFEPAFLGWVDEFAEGDFTKVVLMPVVNTPDAYVRRKVAFVRKNKKDDEDTLSLPGQGEFSVISNVCMHLGCPVQAAASGFVCPCHGGAYNADGKRIGGPPVRPLDRYIWEKEERKDDDGKARTALIATALYSTDNQGNRHEHRDPGQPTSGPESWLYPLQP